MQKGAQPEVHTGGTKLCVEQVLIFTYSSPKNTRVTLAGQGGERNSVAGNYQGL
jgi:hypothetical protein